MSGAWLCPGCGQRSVEPRIHVGDCVLVNGAGHAKPAVAVEEMKPGQTYSVPWYLTETYVRWGRAEVTIPDDDDLLTDGDTLMEWLYTELNDHISSNGAGELGSKTKQYDVDVDETESIVEAD